MMLTGLQMMLLPNFLTSRATPTGLQVVLASLLVELATPSGLHSAGLLVTPSGP